MDIQDEVWKILADGLQHDIDLARNANKWLAESRSYARASRAADKPIVPFELSKAEAEWDKFASSFEPVSNLLNSTGPSRYNTSEI
ncbi:MAG: hypothetical protein CYPHOPRED_002963 [Cyphobasidiales sp. Tagirdzhanova-0007]|nr:MAG: hypothetical protein CYPHOPRED_002963 [Cyphobasidiales sp. Tagirdzhanova-0007]